MALLLLLVCIVRLRKFPKHYALNPLLHLCLFVSIYIGLGSFLLKHTVTIAFNLKINSDSVLNAEFFALLMQILVFLMIVFSRRPNKYKIQLRRQEYFNVFMTVSIVILIILTLMVSLKIPPNILLYSRVDAHELYLRNFGSYGLNTILYLLLVIYALRIYRYNYILFVALLFLSLVPLVHGSRNLTFALLWVNLFISLSKKDQLDYRVFLHPAMLGIIFLSGMWFFLRFPDLNVGLVTILYKFFAEAGNTAVSLAALLDNSLRVNEQNSLMHLTIMLLPFLKVINTNDYFAHIINDKIIQAPYSLSANFLAEFYYYFDFIGFFILPIYLLVLSILLERKYLFLYIWSISSVCVMRVAVRGSMIEAFASAFTYAALIYLLVLLFGVSMRREL